MISWSMYAVFDVTSIVHRIHLELQVSNTPWQTTCNTNNCESTGFVSER
jgi:hypothetical protein